MIKVFTSSHCTDTVQMREESESGIRKWEKMWFKMTAEDGERAGQQWRVMEDCSTDERLQQETLCHRQWTDEYVEHPETLMRQNIVIIWLQCLLVDVVSHVIDCSCWFCVFCCCCHCYNWHKSTIQSKLPVVINKQWLKSLDFCF